MRHQVICNMTNFVTEVHTSWFELAIRGQKLGWFCNGGILENNKGKPPFVED